MPTPSPNPPPELPPRNHSSSCPDDSWGPGTSNWNGEYASQDVSTATGNAIAPSATAFVATLQSTISDQSDDMRSATNSPRPESIAAASLPGTSATHDTNQHHDTTDRASSVESSQHYKADEVPAQGSSGSRDDRGTPSSQSTLTSRLRSDVDEDSHGSANRNDEIMPGISDEEDSCYPPMGYEFSNKRIAPISPSTFLRPGARFHGTQQSERQVYDVQVELKYVDLRESYLCGYLKIQGLTEDNPTLTTFFEGEIVGSKYGFITRHEGWGATEKVDINHWSKFSAFRQYKSQVRKGASVPMGNLAHRENIFMRWKEHFLVPDHRVRTISGASFEGFYYICFNMKEGSVSGIYFHSRSEKFQQLELKYQEDRGSFGAVEFR